MGRFLQMAIGSASELEYQLLLARDLKYLESSQHNRLEGQVTEVKRMLSALMQKVRTDSWGLIADGWPQLLQSAHSC